MKKFSIILIICLLGVVSLNIPDKTYAAKKFVKTKSTAAKTTTSKAVSGTSIPSVVKYRDDKKGLLLSFSNFNGLDSVSYSFTYSTNGSQQGIGGVVRQDNNPSSARELLFGTCSTSVCSYHQNLTNARLTLTAKYTNGRTVNKSYRIKTYF